MDCVVHYVVIVFFATHKNSSFVFHTVTVNDIISSLCSDNGRGTPTIMFCIGLAGKGDHVMQNPGGQMDRPVNFHFLERSAQIVYTVFGVCEVNEQMNRLSWLLVVSVYMSCRQL